MGFTYQPDSGIFTQNKQNREMEKSRNSTYLFIAYHISDSSGHRGAKHSYRSISLCRYAFRKTLVIFKTSITSFTHLAKTTYQTAFRGEGTVSFWTCLEAKPAIFFKTQRLKKNVTCYLKDFHPETPFTKGFKPQK